MPAPIGPAYVTLIIKKTIKKTTLKFILMIFLTEIEKENLYLI